jgi:nitrite reductase (NADH) large subunit
LNRRVVLLADAPRGVIVELDDGSRLPADLVIVASGVRPRDDVARAADLRCGRRGGVIVDAALNTSDPHISAIGECATFEDAVSGFVAPCYAMAETLASRLRGDDTSYTPPAASASLKVPELAVNAVGDSLAEHPGTRTLTWVKGASYRRLVLDQGRIIGAVAVGERGDFGLLQEAVARASRIRTWQEKRFVDTGSLWRRGTATSIEEWSDEAIVCTCTGVTCGALRIARGAGARSSPAICERTGAGSGCGSCLPLVEEFAGERAAAVRSRSGQGALVMAVLSFLLLGAAALFGPIPMSSSVQQTPQLDVLWRDADWKQISGYSLLGLCVLSLAFSIRKRLPAVRFGSFGNWRFAHTLVGVATIVGAGVHTGMRLGSNLNFALMVSFLGVVLLGALTAVVINLEGRLPAPYGSLLRRVWSTAHVALFWPMPVLVTFHVLSVYFY